MIWRYRISVYSFRRVHKYAHIHKRNDSGSGSGGNKGRLPAAPLALSKERELRESGRNSSSTTVIAIANFTSIPQDLSHAHLHTADYANSTSSSTLTAHEPHMVMFAPNCTDPDPRNGNMKEPYELCLAYSCRGYINFGQVYARLLRLLKVKRR